MNTPNRLALTTISSTTHHHHHPEEEEEIEEIPQDHFPANIFKPKKPGEQVPEGFDAVLLSIDGTIQADLSWNEAHLAAETYTQQGLRIFWDIELGLFDKLTKPLHNQSQFLSLSLSLDHFRDTLWNKYRSQTIGLSIYRGSPDFQHAIYRDDKIESDWNLWKDGKDLNQDLFSLFCANLGSEYLNLLTNRMPDTLPCFAFFDPTEISKPILIAQLLTKERYPTILLSTKNSSGLGGDFIWKETSASDQLLHVDISATKIGVCLPPLAHFGMHSELINEVLLKLKNNNDLFRIIPEHMLTTDWDYLDYLIVQSTALSTQGRRKLLGFCAAGGTIVTIGPLLNLPTELSLENWLQLNH